MGLDLHITNTAEGEDDTLIFCQPCTIVKWGSRAYIGVEAVVTGHCWVPRTVGQLAIGEA